MVLATKQLAGESGKEKYKVQKLDTADRPPRSPLAAPKFKLQSEAKPGSEDRPHHARGGLLSATTSFHVDATVPAGSPAVSTNPAAKRSLPILLMVHPVRSVIELSLPVEPDDVERRRRDLRAARQLVNHRPALSRPMVLPPAHEQWRGETPHLHPAAVGNGR